MAKKTTKKRGRATSKFRASWKGQLSFGLVSLPVEAFNAIEPGHSDIHFHQLHAECHSRIQHKKVCPVHGDVSNDEIVSGYEYRKGQYVEIEPEELESLRSEEERALKIDAFVNPDLIDPLYFDGRMYYLVPAGPGAQEPYVVILEAMKREARYGVGRVVFSGKDQLVLVRPLEGVLHMAMLNYEAEIRPPRKVAGVLPKPTPLGREVRLAQKLIEEWSQDSFDFSRYEDPYREKVEELIEAKVHGRDIVTPEKEEPEKIMDLMEALKRSVGKLQQDRGKSRRGKKSA